MFLGRQVVRSHSYTQSGGPKQYTGSHSLKSVFKGVNPMLNKAEQGSPEWMNPVVFGSCRIKAKGLGVEILSMYCLNPIDFSNNRVMKEGKNKKLKEIKK